MEEGKCQRKVVAGRGSAFQARRLLSDGRGSRIDDMCWAKNQIEYDRRSRHLGRCNVICRQPYTASGIWHLEQLDRSTFCMPRNNVDSTSRRNVKPVSLESSLLLCSAADDLFPSQSGMRWHSRRNACVQRSIQCLHPAMSESHHIL